MKAYWMILAAVAAATSTACGSDAGACKPPSVQGAPFGAVGTGTLTGNGTLPAGVKDGLQLQVELIQGGASVGVLPDNLLENDSVCGKSFHYTVNKIEAGTYRLGVLVSDPNDENIDAKPVFEGQAPSEFTIADGQTLTQDTVFQPKP